MEDRLKEEILNGILRSPNVKSPLARRRSVHFQPPNNLQGILTRYSNGESCMEEVEGLITHVHNLRGDPLIRWIQELQENVAILKPKLEHFVFSLLKISWASQETNVSECFKNFLINLLSAHSYYIKPVVKHLMINLIGKAENDEEIENLIFNNTHNVIRAILRFSPLNGRQEIVHQAGNCFPYILTPMTHSHNSYAANLLKLSKYIGNSDRGTILRIVIERVVQLDVRLPKNYAEPDSEDEDQFAMEEEEEETKSVISCRTNVTLKTDVTSEEMTVQIARNNLDSLMNLIFEYIRDETNREDENVVKKLYFDFLNSFESLILPTWATCHVQFLVFYFVSLKPESYATHLLEWLWKKFNNPNTAGIVRQSCVSYMASLTARGKFIDLKITKNVLHKLVDWVHSYIKNAEIKDFNNINVDIKSHGPFYAACQSALYIFAFRHYEFVSSPKLMTFLKSCNFNTIVTCHLNPLRVCLPPVVKNFASISRNYQLAYCDTIIQRNNRINIPIVGHLSDNSGNKPLLLDSFFPFDPYLLSESKIFIRPLYRDYVGNQQDDDESSDDEIDSEIEEMDVAEGKKEALANSFLYGTSPGFKF